MTSLSAAFAPRHYPGYVRKAVTKCLRYYHLFRTRNAPAYRNPTDLELIEIEDGLLKSGIKCNDMFVDVTEFKEFVRSSGFPVDYHGGTAHGVFYEKLLEHYFAWKILNLDDLTQGPYIDIAACTSPWAKILHEKGVDSYAIDLAIPDEYVDLGYYRREDATMTGFRSGEIGRASLQCAYEMFLGSHDIDLIYELGRILKDNGVAIITPLYMHTHPCYYQTPEYYGHFQGDEGAKSYVRRDCWGVPASRKYSPQTLKSRVFDKAIQVGLVPELFVLRNKEKISPEIYLHFILVFKKIAHDTISRDELTK